MALTAKGAVKYPTGNHAIGFQADGKDLMIAHLIRNKHGIAIFSIQRLTLSSPVEGGPTSLTGSMPTADLSPFGADLEASVAGMVGSGEAPEDDERLLHSALARLPLMKSKLGIAIAPANVRFFNAGEPQISDKPNTLVDRIRGVAQAKIGETVTANNSHVELQAGAPSWCIVHRDEMVFINRLEAMRKSLGNPRMRYSLIDPVEVSLVGLMNREWLAASQEITVLIHIGREYTHLIILHGSDVITVAPLIQTGSVSPALLQTLASKILLEQDEVGIAEIHRIALSGQVIQIEAKEFFERKYPAVKVKILGNGGCDDYSLTEEERSILPEFTVAIGLALKLLDPSGYWKSNLLPESVKRSQRVLSFAWHGYLLLLLLFVSTVFLAFSTMKESRAVKINKSTLVLRKQQEQGNQWLRTELEQQNALLLEMQRMLAVSDSLSAGSQRWSKLLLELDISSRKIGSVWLESIQNAKDGITVMGKSLTRARINDVSKLFPNTIIQSVQRVEIQGKTVYQFELKIPFPPEDPAAPGATGVPVDDSRNSGSTGAPNPGGSSGSGNSNPPTGSPS
ncbi:MAG: hypothetical protein OEM52_10410 [bacterium]|nr:hypothetical protein [bacterium]